VTAEDDVITAYVLGELSPGETARLEARERDDPRFAAEAARMRRVVARLGDLDAEQFRPVAPPPLRVDVQDVGRPPAAPARPRRGGRGWGDRLRARLAGPVVLRPSLAALAVVGLLAAGAVGGAVLGGGDDVAGPGRGSEDLAAQPGAQRVALRTLADAPSGAGAQAAMAGGRMQLRVHGLRPTARADFYEVWLLRSPGDLVSLGTFRVGQGGTASVTLPLTVDPKRFPVLDVSVEPVDGNPAHSSRSVLRSDPIS